MENIVNGFDFGALPISVSLVGETSKDIWLCDQWNVVFKYNGEIWTTAYFTGIGLREEIKGIRANFVKTFKIVGRKRVPAVAVRPKNSDIMYSLLMDATASDYSFNDWCSNYGYSSDSIKAFNAYQTCCETEQRLLKIFGREKVEAMREALQDC